MNEEEKKAVELLENIKNSSWTVKYIMSRDSKNAEVLLKLIEKLSKELEEKTTIILAGAKKVKQLEEDNEEIEEINNELDIAKNEAIRRYNFETVPIQKIKDKIEELKQEKKKIGNCLIEIYEDELIDKYIEVLQELLEK